MSLKSESPDKTQGQVMAKMEFFSKLGTCIAVVVAVAYFISWQYERHYYTAIGANWLAAELSQTEVLSLLMPFAVPFVLFLALFGSLLHSEQAKRRTIDLIGSILGVLYIVVAGLAYIAASSEWYTSAACLNILASLLLPVSIAAYLILMLTSDKSATGGWNASHSSSLHVVLLLVISYLPSYQATTVALLDRNAEFTTLPEVALLNDSAHWKLLHHAARELIVMKIDQKGGAPTFKIVSTEQVVSISAPRAHASK